MIRLDTPIVEDLGLPYRLVATWAGLTDTGLRVQVDVYEDAMLVHPNQVTLGSAASRALYVKHARVQVPGLDEQILAGRLVQLLPKVEAALKLQMAAPAPPPPAQRSEDELLALCGDLARAPDLLERINKTIGQLGVVGEERVRQLLYLAATARLLSLSDMINVQGDGPSSAGKTWTFGRVIKMLPEDACHDFTRISPQYLAYMQASLEHKIVFIQEIDTLTNDDTTVQMVRSLLSEGYVKVGTVDVDASGARVGRDIVKPGPTQLFTTSAGHKRTDAQLNTRLHRLEFTDGEAQTQAILIYQGQQAVAPQLEPDLSAYHGLQEWLECFGRTSVRVPYGLVLAGLVPHKEVRARRDFPRLLAFLKACAFLHQQQRPVGPDGAVHATLEDYRLVYNLVRESYTATQIGGVTRAEREAVAAVAAACKDTGTTVTLTAVAKKLGSDPTSTRRRLLNPLDKGYVLNAHAGQQGKRAAYQIGEELPPEVSALPAPEQLEQAWQGGGGYSTPAQSSKSVKVPADGSPEAQSTPGGGLKQPAATFTPAFTSPDQDGKDGKVGTPNGAAPADVKVGVKVADAAEAVDVSVEPPGAQGSRGDFYTFTSLSGGLGAPPPPSLSAHTPHKACPQCGGDMPPDQQICVPCVLAGPPGQGHGVGGAQ